MALSQTANVLANVNRQNHGTDENFVSYALSRVEGKLSTKPGVERVFTNANGQFDVFGNLESDEVLLTVTLKLNGNLHNSVLRDARNTLCAYQFVKRHERTRTSETKWVRTGKPSGVTNSGKTELRERDIPKRTRIVTFEKRLKKGLHFEE